MAAFSIVTFSDELYFAFSRLYSTVFNDSGPKLYKCSLHVILVENKAEQIDVVKKFYEGKLVKH